MTISVWWLSKEAEKTDTYFNQITFHWFCPTQNIKWLMVDSWQCHAKLQHLELQRDPCHILVHHNTIRGWHMHCALSMYTVPVHSRCALSLVPRTMHCALCTVPLYCAPAYRWSGGDICSAEFEKWLPDCAHPKMSHNAIMTRCTDEKTGAL